MAQDSTSMTMGSQSQMNHASSARKRVAKNENLLLEDYIHFLHSRQSIHLTMQQLNEVIRIHGFKKIHHAPKKVLSDAVDALDLVKLQRSTLRENVSAFAVLTVEDVVADLAELNWQECCVTSLEKLSSSNYNNDENHSLLFLPASSSDHRSLLQLTNHSHLHSPSQSQSEKQLFSQKRRMEEMSDSLIPEAFKSSLRAVKMVPRRKRSGFNATPAVFGTSRTVDSASLASC